MPRSGDRVRGLLQEAALDLFREHGYDETTTADIALRAGVNHRTFFRHFPDKREVLFGGETMLCDQLVDGIHDAPGDAGPMAAMCHAFESVFPAFEANRSFAAARAAIIRSHAALRERAGAKQASLSTAIAGALASRGIAQNLAAMAAEVGMVAFTRATSDWLADPSRDLDSYLEQAVAELATLTAGTSSGRPPR